MTRGSLARRGLVLLHRWIGQLADPMHAAAGLRGYAAFFSDWLRYRRLPGAERIRLLETWPQVHDKTPHTPFDAHYFYANGWAARQIVAHAPRLHVDVGSDVMFVNLVSASVPTLFIDYRPLHAGLLGLRSIAGNIVSLPLATASVSSLSCLHVAEHIGLGRYGDPLDPAGTRKAAAELTRVLAPGGDLYFAIPVGRPRLCFNGARILSVENVIEEFAPLSLVALAGVHDDGSFAAPAGRSDFAGADYACGLFHFRKPEAPAR